MDQTAAVADERSIDPLCQHCRPRGIWDHLTGKVIMPNDQIILGFVADPADLRDPVRKKCPFCNWIFTLLPTNALEKRDSRIPKDRTSCNLIPVTHRVGRKANFTSFEVTSVVWEYVSLALIFRERYLVAVGLDTALRQQYNVRGVSPWKLSSTLDAGLVCKWLRVCDASHAACKAIRQRPLMSRNQPLEILLLDIAANCIIEADTNEDYIALSYVWGGVQTLQMTIAHKDELMTPGILGESTVLCAIAPVIRNCMSLAGSLGLRYIWVDCLCIVQDDSRSKHAQIAKMDLIYSEAYLTVLQYTGQDAMDGLPGVTAISRHSCSSKTTSQRNDFRGMEFVITHMPSFYSGEVDSAYETRAWTLQERVLSCRCLYLTSWGMWLQCLDTLHSDTDSGELLRRPDFRMFSPDLDGKQGRKKEVLCWCLNVEWYSGRSLSYQSDRLDACLGIMRRIGEMSGQTLLWGHLEEFAFPLSLLWVSVDVPFAGYGDGPGRVSVEDKFVPERDTVFPTWSWLGWNGRVSYRLLWQCFNDYRQPSCDDDVQVIVRDAIAPNVANTQGTVEHFTPNMIRRYRQRGFLDILAPSMSYDDICWRALTGLQLTTMDGQDHSMALAHVLYPYSRPYAGRSESAEMTEDRGCGILLGIPWSSKELHPGMAYYFVLIRTMAAHSLPTTVQGEWERHIGPLHEGDEIVLTLALVTPLPPSLRPSAERKGVAIFGRTFWTARQPQLINWILV